MEKRWKVLLYRLTATVAICQLFTFCNALSLPQTTIEDNDNRQQGDRAVIGGLMALFPENNNGAVYIFVVNEYDGEQLVRQSICDRYMANQMEMTEDYVSN